MTYFVIAYRWGYSQEQSCLFSSGEIFECIDVAESYPHYRGGKYGCAIYQSPSLEDRRNGDGGTDPLYYFPSLLGEKKPTYNHRCDVFNVPVCAITYDKRYPEAPEWIRNIISEAKQTADRRNEMEARKV